MLQVAQTVLDIFYYNFNKNAISEILIHKTFSFMGSGVRVNMGPTSGNHSDMHDHYTLMHYTLRFIVLELLFSCSCGCARRAL